jgi:hypothetical protein
MIIPLQNEADRGWTRRGLLRSLWVVAMGGLGLLSLACGEKGIASLAHHPVKGKVILPDGKPLTTGRVVFVSTSTPSEFSGDIGADGSFSMKTPAGEGLPEGKYLVRLDADVPTTGQATKGKPASRKTAVNLPFPAKYADETTSELTATVKAGDNQLEPFKLTAGPSGAQGKGSRVLDQRD